MMSLAQQSGDVEQVVAILERDLSTAYRFLQIAEVWREAGKADKALAWAERGVAAFPEKTGHRLRLFLAEEFQRHGRHQEAIRLVWFDSQDHSSLDAYLRLERFARKDDDTEDWRERALRSIRRDLEPKPDAKPARAPIQYMAHSWNHRKRDHSLLAEIFLYERNVEDAWREAQA